MPKILVTGGAGYIGSHTVHLLLKQNFEVVVVDDLSRGHRHNVDAKRLREMSLFDTSGLARVMGDEGVAAVIHFAAFIAVGESTQKPELYFSNNVGGSLSLFNAMARANVKRLVFSSTAAVYGTPEIVPIPETSPISPINPYGETKAMIEKTLGWLDRSSGLRSIALRYFNACGANPDAGLGEEHHPETHLIPLVLRAIQTGEPLNVFGDDYPTPDGTCVRDYVHVDDLAQAHILALESLLSGCASNAFNVGTGLGNSVREVIQAAEKITGRKVPLVMGPRREGDPPTLVADSRKLRETLGWKPVHTSLERIVGDAWQFMRG